MLMGFFKEIENEQEATKMIKEALYNLNSLQGNDFKTPGVYAIVEIAKMHLQEAIDILN